AFAAPTSAWRMAREASTSTMTPNLGRRIGWRDELWDDVACGAPRRIIQRRQILLDRTAGALRIAVLVPVLTRDRPLLIGVSLDQARVDCKAFATNQT